MTKYYVVPIMESSLLIECRMGEYIPISEYVKKYYPRMAQLETERVSIIYSGDVNSPFTDRQKTQLERNLMQKTQLSKELGIPLNILAIGDGKRVREIETKEVILSSKDSSVFFDFREQPRNIFLTYYDDSYIKRVRRFMNRKNFKVLQGGAQKVIKR